MSISYDYPFSPVAIPIPILDTTLKWYVVTDYGATGNGTTDDTLAIQKAINAAETAGGGIVYFPTGTYIISAAPGNFGLTVSASNIVFLGDGWSAILKQAGAVYIPSGIVTTQPGVNNFWMRDIAVYGNGVPGNVFNAAPLVQCPQGNNNRFYNVLFYNAQGMMLGLDNNADALIDACRFDTSGANLSIAIFMPAYPILLPMLAVPGAAL